MKQVECEGGGESPLTVFSFTQLARGRGKPLKYCVHVCVCVVGEVEGKLESFTSKRLFTIP